MDIRSIDHEAVERSLRHLAVIITKNEPSPLLLQEAVRRVRPSNFHTMPSSHLNAIRVRLRNKLLGHHNDAPELAARFDQQMETLRQLKSSRWKSVLAILEPLAFSVARNLPSSVSLRVPEASPGPVIEEPEVLRAADSSDTIPRQLLACDAPPRAEMSASERKQLSLHFSAAGSDVEKVLLKDLLLVLQGLTSPHIKYDERSGAYVIDPALGVSCAVRDAVLRLCEIGWLYRHIDSAVQAMLGRRSLTAQALAFALQETLQEYFQLLSAIEFQLSNASLLRLQAWLAEPLERLMLMGRVSDTCSSLVGGSLASRLHSYTMHGCDTAKEYVKALMRRVCVPFYRMMTRWLLHGELADDHMKEFIIQPPPAATAGAVSRAGWHNAFLLHDVMIPSFLPSKLAHKILVVGKSIYFTKLCLRLLAGRGPGDASISKKRVLQHSLVLSSEESSSVMMSGLEDKAVRAVDERIAEQLKKVQYGDEERLAVLVSDIAEVTDKRLMYLMDSHFHLSEHLIAMKKFLLLGQGDFVTCLMDMLGGELRKRASQLFRHNLTGILEAALRTCNAQHEPPYILDRLAVRLLEPAPGDSGWEIFSLEYIVDEPLTAVFHDSSILLYRTAFHHLWRLKRVEWSLSCGWKTLMSLLHTKGHNTLKRLRPIFHRCALHRNKMTHLINNLSNYMMFEVVEAAWLRLESELEAAVSLDEVIAAHDKYLSDIEDRALLSAKHEAINMQIQKVMHSILRFCHLEETLVADALSVAARRRAVGQNYTEDAPGTVEGVPGYVIQRLEDSAIDYDAQFHKMMSMLLDQGEKAGEIVRFLVFRLDYNEQVHAHIIPTAIPLSKKSNGHADISSLPEDIDAVAGESLTLSALRTPQQLRSDEEVRNKLLSMLYKK